MCNLSRSRFRDAGDVYRVARERPGVMGIVALLVALQTPAPPPSSPWFGGRVWTSPSLHVGVRPSFYVDSGEVAGAITVQLSCNAL